MISRPFILAPRPLAFGCLIALAGTAPAAAAQETPRGWAELRIATGEPVAKALREQGVALGALAPATLDGARVTLPLARMATAAPMVLAHRGGLTLRAGARSVTLRGFMVTLGKGGKLSVRIGERRPRALRLDLGDRRPQIDRQAGTARLLGARLALTRTGAALLERRLGLDRLSPGRLGAVSVRARFPGQRQSPSPSPPSEPPALSRTEWESSHLEGCSSCDHKSFIKYVVGGPPGSGVGASVTPSDGAGFAHPESDPNHPFDFTLPVVSSSTGAGGTTVQHGGQLRYYKPQHFLDNQIRNMAFELPAVGSLTGRVLADGQYSSRSNPTEPVVFRDEHVLDLNFTGVTPTPVPGGVIYRDVPATVAETGQEELSYEPGKAWGRFTFTAPVR